MTLAPHHLDMLRDESGIDDAVIAARGYRTVTDAAELKALGFAASQCRPPGLLLPLWTPDGKNGSHVYRPDNPRVVEDRRKGKLPDGTYPQRVIKYEQPKGEPTRVDCPPMCQHQLANPAVPLFVTEGQKKADALASRGACAIALLGVWNWKGRNAHGGTVFTADLDYIAFDDRDVYLVFDSDVFTNANVRQALARFTEHLKRKGARVLQASIPSTADGKKLGVDDWFVANPDKTLADLQALATGPQPEVTPAPARVELLPDAPATIARPLALVDGRAYAATWLWARTTVTEKVVKGQIVRLASPEVTTARRLFVIRDDGRVFGDGGDASLEELGLQVHLPEIPPDSKLWSTAGVKAYRAGQRPAPADVFGRVVDIVDRFIDFNRSLGDQRTMAELVACYILATWFLDSFNVIGFLWPNGDRGCGKTQLLTVVAELAYLGQVILAGGSYAALRDLADYGATLAFDDAENLADPRKTDPDKRALLLAGNRRGNTVALKEMASDKVWRTRHVNTFCPRLFSAIHLPDAVLESRTIVVPLIRTPDRFRANADPLEFDLWPHGRRELIDDLWALALAHLPELPAFEKLTNAAATLTGRNLEPWRAVLAVAAWLEDNGVNGIWQRIEGLSTAYQKERPDLAFADLTLLAVRALQKCRYAVNAVSAVNKVTSRMVVKTAQVVEAAQELIEEEELDFDPDYITSRRLGRILGKMRFQKSRDSQAKGWRVDFDALDGWLVSYGLLQTAPLSTNGTNGTNGKTAQTTGADMPRTNGTAAGVVFSPEEVDRLAGPPDEDGRRPALDVMGHYFDEDGRLWDGDEEPLQGTLLFLRKKLEASRA